MKKEDLDRMEEAHRQGILQGENKLLKQILEQLLKIELTPNFDSMSI